MSARSHKIPAGQVEIYAEDTGQGSPALVFLHYWGGSRRTWTGVSGPYIQHNPLVPDGVAGVMGFLKQVGRLLGEVKRIAIDGDLAFVHVRYLNLFGKETAGVDIFRFDDAGKLVEHWDVLQPVPAESKNSNTMF